MRKPEDAPLLDGAGNQGGLFENFLHSLQVTQGGTLPVYYNPTDRNSAMVATDDIGAEVARLLTGTAWSGQGRRAVLLFSLPRDKNGCCTAKSHHDQEQSG